MKKQESPGFSRGEHVNGTGSSPTRQLRKLAVATKIGGPGVWDDAKVLARIYQLNAWGTGLVTATEFIAAANPAAVLDLLDQCDAAVAKLYAAEEKLGEIVAERDALRAHVHELRTELKGAEAQRQRLIQKEADA